MIEKSKEKGKRLVKYIMVINLLYKPLTPQLYNNVLPLINLVVKLFWILFIQRSLRVLCQSFEELFTCEIFTLSSPTQVLFHCTAVCMGR